MMRRRYRLVRPSKPKGPAAPPELRRRPEHVPSGDDVFNWRANEIVLGPPPKRGLSVMDRIRALYAPSEPKDDPK
jgi:hypothetical protein